MPRAVDYRACDDQHYASIWVYPAQVEALALWVTWYKDRGRTEEMWLLTDLHPPRRPMAEDIRRIADYFSDHQ